MDAQTLIDRCHAAGIDLTLRNSAIEFRGTPERVRPWLPLLVEHEQELKRILAAKEKRS